MADNRQGLSGVLVTKQQGFFRFRCESITHGVQLVASESQGRTTSSYFPQYVTEQPFSVTAVCNGYDEYRALIDWLEAYKDLVISTGAHLPVRVTVPARNFDRVGIFSKGGIRGEQVGQYVWHLPLSFEPSTNPLDISLSTFLPEIVDIVDSSFFYPVSIPLPNNAEDGIYGDIIGITSAHLRNVILQQDRQGL